WCIVRFPQCSDLPQSGGSCSSRWGNRQNTASSPEPCPHLLCRKVRSGTLRWLRPFRLSAWRGRTPVLQYRVKCFFLWLSSQELFKFFNYNPVLLEHLPVLATAEVVVQPLE